eukprot:1364188-Lingulodinium_polyedra.AAC.1
MLKKSTDAFIESGGRVIAWDDVRGVELDANGVKEARETEIEFFNAMNAYTRCARKCVDEENGKIIDLKWIDTNKGDAANP